MCVCSRVAQVANHWGHGKDKLALDERVAWAQSQKDKVWGGVRQAGRP